MKRPINGLVLLYMILLSVATSADTLRPSDPFLGIWTLNVKLSKYPPNACPRRMTIVMSTTPEGIGYHSETLFASGKVTTADYTGAYDGKPVIVVGSSGVMLPVSLKRENSRTVLATYLRGFRLMATCRRVVSADGQQMLITTKSESATGKMVTTIGMYVKTKQPRRHE